MDSHTDKEVYQNRIPFQDQERSEFLQLRVRVFLKLYTLCISGTLLTVGGWAVLETGPKFHKFGYQGSLHMPRLPPLPSLTGLSPGGTAATTVVPLMRSPSVSAGSRIDPGRLIIDDEQAIPATQ